MSQRKTHMTARNELDNLDPHRGLRVHIRRQVLEQAALRKTLDDQAADRLSDIAHKDAIADEDDTEFSRWALR